MALKDHWTATPALRAAIGDGDPFQRVASLEGETFREKDGRRTFRFEVQGRGYFAKLHGGVALAEALKELTSWRTPPLDAGREARALERLHHAGVPAAKVAGWGVRGRGPLSRESFVITEDVGSQRTLGDLAASLDAADFRGRRRLIRCVADLVRTMHGAGVNHRDLYFGHILAPKAGAPLVLIDLHRAQIWKRIPLRWIVKDLGALGFAALPLGLSRTDRARFVSAYTGGRFANCVRGQPRLWGRVLARVERTDRERRRKGARFGG